MVELRNNTVVSWSTWCLCPAGAMTSISVLSEFRSRKKCCIGRERVFERTNLLSERIERNHFMNWFVPFSVQLSSAAIMPARSGTAATHSWIFGERRSQRAGGDSFACTRRIVRTWFTFVLWFIHDLQTYCTQRTVTEDMILVHALCWKWHCVTHSLTQGRGVDSRSVTLLLKLALCC